ncbi:MAG: C40 family peptidase [Treponema sp.]|nr:C40 family peptidase [Treponema sp.]
MNPFPKPDRLLTAFMLLVFSACAWLHAAPLEGGYALAPGPSASPEERARAYQDARVRVLLAAEKYEKTPYRYGGLDRNGLDCSGFIYVSFRDALGVLPPRTSVGLYTWTDRINDNKIQPGDLLFFKTDNSGRISHAGLYIGNGRFIHSASAGPNTGVMYSSLSESYWSRTYAGAGRAFPEADAAFQPVLASTNVPAAPAAASANAAPPASGGSVASVRPGRDIPANVTASSESGGRLLLGLAIAPTWKAFMNDGDFFRGFASQLRLGAETGTFGRRMIFGFEIRPEYDAALGVFRLPFTFSWGPSDKFMIFAGPVLSFGDAILTVDGEQRRYSGGTSWLGAIGITAAPFIFNAANGELAPYMEIAWQSYISDNRDSNPNADFSAGFRFSTGIRWSWQVR